MTPAVTGVIPLWKRIARERWAYYFLALPAGLLVLFGFFPVVFSFFLSMAIYAPDGIRWVGIRNYIDAFTDWLFHHSLWVTAIYVVGVVPVGLCIALCLSGLITSLSSRLQTFFKSAFYLPAVASGVILSLVWIWIFNPTFGLLNYLVSFLGISAQTWLGNPNQALFSLILMSWVGGHGAAIVLLCAAIGGIPDSYYEAAKMDGCGPVRTFFLITIPLVKPTILYLLVMGTIQSFQVFSQIYIMTEGGPYHATTTIGYLIYATAFERFDFGKASAEAVVLFLITGLIAFVQYRWLATDVEY